MVQNKKIILSPLDWGLGHATRCIPLIRKLLENNNEVWVAGNETCKSLILEEFPNIPFLDLPGYRIQYANTARKLPWVIGKQLLKIWKAVRHEHHWLQKAIETYHFELVISDNRFGFYSKKIPSIFITHQLNIQAPNRFLHRLANMLNHYYLKKFKACWIPDYDDRRLSGNLSFYEGTVPVTFIGPLSRFQKPNQVISKEIDYLFILSGPEPQRTLLEKKILEEFSHDAKRKVLVRGLPGEKENWVVSGFEIYNHCSLTELQELLSKTHWVISRAGYSSIMDYDALNCQAVLIPTPGQTEQVYLAQRFEAQKRFGIAFQTQPLRFQIEKYTINKSINNSL